MAKIQMKDEHIKVQDLVDLSPVDFLLEKSGSVFAKLNWTFSENEIQYFEAWKNVVPRTRVLAEQGSTLRYEETSLDQLVIETPVLDYHERKTIRSNEFKSLSRKKGREVATHYAWTVYRDLSRHWPNQEMEALLEVTP